MSANVVGKRVLHVKHGRSASSRASPRRELKRSNSVLRATANGSLFGVKATRSGRRPEALAAVFSSDP